MVSRQPAAKARGMVSLAEAAELAGLSTKTLRRRIAEGALPAFRTGPRLIRVYPADLVALVKPMNAAAAERLDAGTGNAPMSPPGRRPTGPSLGRSPARRR